MGQLLTTLEITRISWKAGFSEMQPPKAKWVPERDMPSLEGKVVLITGACLLLPVGALSNLNLDQ